MKRKLLFAIAALLCSVGMMAQIDVTSYLTNPSFETGDMTGWTSYGYNPEGSEGLVDVSSAAGSKAVADYPLSNSDGTYICDFYLNRWTGWWSFYRISQTVTLPAGTYQLSAIVGAKKNYTVTLFAFADNGGNLYDLATYTNRADQSLTSDEQNNVGYEKTVTFTSDGTTPTVLGAGLINHISIPEIFFKADNFKLYLISTTDYHDYSSIINQSSWKFDEDDGSGTTTASTTNVNQGDYTGSHIERYRGLSGHYGKKLYQTITDLPAGVYKVKASCMTAAANGVEGDYALADNTKYNAYFYANNNALTYPLKNATSSYRDNYVYLSEGGSIEFGVKTVAVGANWSAIANASLELISKDYSHYQHIMLPRLLEELEGLRTYASSYGPIQKSAKATLQGVLSTYADVDETDIDAVSTAVAALQTAIGNAVNNHKTYVSTLYAPYQRLISTQVSPKSATLTTLSEHYNASAYDTFEELIADYQAIEIENLGTTTGAFTSVIINNSFELDGTATNSPTGWDIPNKGNDYGARTLGSSGSTYYMTNADGSYVFNNWQNWWMTCDLSQTITGLPNGEYELTAVIAGYSDAYTNLTANGESTVCATAGEAVGVKTTVTAFVSDGTLVIGADNTGCYHKRGDIWQTFLKVDKFELTYNGIKPLLKDLIDEAQDIVDEGVNVGTDPFQIPASAQSTLDDAIDDAELVYDNGSATFDDVQDAIDDLNAAISAYKNATLIAPASGVQYRIKSTAADAADWKNKYYVLKKGGNESQGGYSIRAEGSDAAYLATAWQFTPISGNEYKLSMIDADGTTRYICTAIKGYDAGSATQIRTTTDASKALVVKVIAATGTDGRWYLQNTEDDSYIGGQDAGFYSNSQNYDLALEAAEKASVPVTISAGKYATRIFPFKPSFIDDITYYTCTALSGSSLILTPVENEEDLAANTPYILYNSSESEINIGQEGYGTAKQDTYTIAPFTGFYTAQTITAGNYVLQTQAGKQAFYKLEEDATANQVYRAYLTVPSGVKPAAFFFDEGQADAISDVRGQMEDGRSEIFNLVGQRVNKAQKGLYIINGKKVLVK